MEILLNGNNRGIYYLNLKRNENIIQDKLLFRIDKLYRQDILNSIENGGELSVNIKRSDNMPICLYKASFVTNYIYLLEEHDCIEEILLDVNMMNNESILGEGYNQFIIDVFYNWSQNIEVEWNKIESIEMKNSYLKACYLWNNKLFVIKNVNEVCIKGNFINCEEDLYYYFGKYFCGERGFFGSNLDSLQDLLIDIVKNNTINTCIIFSNVEFIIKNTSIFFFEKIIYLLEKAKFKIKIVYV